MKFLSKFQSDMNYFILLKVFCIQYTPWCLFLTLPSFCSSFLLFYSICVCMCLYACACAWSMCMYVCFGMFVCVGICMVCVCKCMCVVCVHMNNNVGVVYVYVWLEHDGQALSLNYSSSPWLIESFSCLLMTNSKSKHLRNSSHTPPPHPTHV